MFLIFNNERFFGLEENGGKEFIDAVIKEIKEKEDKKQEIKDLNTLKEKYGRNVMILNSDNQLDNIMMKSGIFDVFNYFDGGNCMLYTATLAMKLKKLGLTDGFKVIEGYFLMNKNGNTSKAQHTYIIDKNNNIIDYTYFQFRNFQKDLNQGKYSVTSFDKKDKKSYSIDEYLIRLKKYRLEVVFQKNRNGFYNGKKDVNGGINNELVQELNSFGIINLLDL